MKREMVLSHCEQIGFVVTTVYLKTCVTAGKEMVESVMYWYVKYHRADKSDKVLFTNANDWLNYMNILKPIDNWHIGHPNLDESNLRLERMQYLTKQVMQGHRFTCEGHEIWAEMTANARYEYYVRWSDGRQERFITKHRWRSTIKSYLWHWEQMVGDVDDRELA